MNYFCLITFRPNKIWCDFLNLFTHYKVVIIVDDNKINLEEFTKNYQNIKFVQIDNIKCEISGYKDMNWTLKKLVSGWDKAIYYFGVENTDYDFIWFAEDDVFFYNEETLKNIDKQYLNEDLLSNKIDENKTGERSSWLWSVVKIKFPPPYYHGMVCSVRFSTNMMKYISDYAKEHNTLFFLEALFPTLAKRNNLNYSIPTEFNNITWRNKFEKQNINKINLYHPVKDINSHITYRNNLQNETKNEK
jgi:hypothetical protein